LAVVPAGTLYRTERIRPPTRLNAAESALWRRTVNALPADYLTDEHAPQLLAYCRHLARADQLQKLADEMEPGSDEFCRLLTAQAQQTKAALAFARALRLTNQSRYDALKAGRHASRPSPRGIDALSRVKGE